MAYNTLDKKWIKPALIILCEDEPLLGTGGNAGKWDLGTNYIYLTDDNRGPVAVTPQRIETKQRMLNGRMRSHFVTDKKSFSTSWDNLPSRSAEGSGEDDRKYISEYEKRTSGFSIKYAAGQDIKDWYETYTGDFWMMLVYDANFVALNSNQVEVYNVFFEGFDYSIEKRGQYNDLWSVSINLVEA